MKTIAKICALSGLVACGYLLAVDLLGIGTNGQLGPVTLSPNLVYNKVAGLIYTTNNPPTIQRLRVQTDVNGNYTWTYPTAFVAIPIVTAIAEGGTNQPINVQIVGSPTLTNCVFKVITLPSTSVLSIVVLGAPIGSQTYINITAIAQ